MRSTIQWVKLGLLGFVVAGCDDITGLDDGDDDEGVNSAVLVGCLSAGGTMSATQLSWVPSIGPWVADVPIFGLAQTIDSQLTAITVHAAQQFGVAPSVRYYNDGASPNAFAAPVNTEQSRDGTVRVGVNMVAGETKRFVATEYGRTRLYTYSVTAVLVHELGHIVQFKRAMPAPSRNTELQADFLAGWYFSYLAQNDPNFALNAGLQDGMRAFYERGDYMFNHPGHHGTPDQRVQAFLAGYNARARDINAAWTASVAYRQTIGG